MVKAYSRIKHTSIFPIINHLLLLELCHTERLINLMKIVSEKETGNREQGTGIKVFLIYLMKPSCLEVAKLVLFLTVMLAFSFIHRIAKFYCMVCINL